RPLKDGNATWSPEHKIGSGASQISVNPAVRGATKVEVTPIKMDPSKTIGPIVIMPGTARPKREASWNLGASKNSGSRPVFNLGTQGSKTNGGTTWTGGVNHSTNLQNGNTQIFGGVEQKVGSGTVHAGGQINIDNHGRSNHGVHVGASIPF
ncbi:hypothetical protein PENTCL1PPCAC_3064, partial [Pristionchus entomophagus]